MQYSIEERRKLLNSLPAELKETLLSEETANTIGDICQRHQIQEKDILTVSKLVGDVLTGILPPEELAEDLKNSLGIEEQEAEKVSREINRFIFFPVKRALAGFYQEISFAPSGRIEKRKGPKPRKNRPEDPYREPIPENE